ncbi:MAG: SH3 domain-containing protein [Alphaproteobacteria bacterium]|nr:SH3 domain-containing protein [Alphaproteobacteria bacterium]
MLEGYSFPLILLSMMENKLLILLIITFFLCIIAPAYAKEIPASSLIPRFMTFSADEVNVRTGPGQRYPIRVVFKKEGLPIEIVKEFDGWCQMRSKDGDEGWVHKSLLSSKRTVIVRGSTRTLFKKPKVGAMPVVKLEPGVIANLDRCNKEWCYLKAAGYKGWLERENIWGVYPDEVFIK